MSSAKFIGIMATDEDINEMRELIDIAIARMDSDINQDDVELMTRLYEALGRAR